MSSQRRRIVRNTLSIDGSGFRGLTQLQMLRELMIRHSGKTEAPSRPCEVFDLICGSGAGGLIAILVGRLEMTCEQAIGAYNYLESTIFNSSTPALRGPPSSPPRIPDPPRHEPAPTIQDILDNTPFDTERFRTSLDWIIKHFSPTGPNMRPDDETKLRCKTLVTVVPTSAAFDVDATRIRSYTSPRRLDGTQDPNNPFNRRWLIRDAAMGTTSCPSTFDPFSLPSQQDQEEGPLEFMAANTAGFSNPSMIAYLETRDIDQHLGFTLISLGMGLRRLTPFRNPNPSQTEDEDSPPTRDDIDRIVGQLGGNPRWRDLINQTLRVGTSAQIKHLRLATLMSRNPKYEYKRFDPPRLTDQHPLVFVDYAQRSGIDTMVQSYLGSADPLLTEAMDIVQGIPSRWIRLPGYGSTSDPDPDFRLVPGDPLTPDRSINTRLTTTQIMARCYRWEANTATNPSSKRISCFSVNPLNRPDPRANKTVRVYTGDFVAEQAQNSELFVRVHLSDQWLFIRQCVPSWPNVPTGTDDPWNGSFRDPARDSGSLISPIPAIQKAESLQSSNIMAFTSEGDYSTSEDLEPDQINVYQTTFTHPFHGTWIRAYRDT